jgi:hypothetical protein
MHDTGHSLVVQVLEIAVNIRLRQKTDRLPEIAIHSMPAKIDL